MVSVNVVNIYTGRHIFTSNRFEQISTKTDQSIGSFFFFQRTNLLRSSLISTKVFGLLLLSLTWYSLKLCLDKSWENVMKIMTVVKRNLRFTINFVVIYSVLKENLL